MLLMRSTFMAMYSTSPIQAAVALAVVCLTAAEVRADFFNGSFEDTTVPLNGWQLQYSHYRGHYTFSAWSLTPPNGHPLPGLVTASDVEGGSIPAPCGSHWATINGLVAGAYATHLSQSAVLTADEVGAGCAPPAVTVTWIMVLVAPNHHSYEDPYFAITVDLNGTMIDSYSATGHDAAASNSGWTKSKENGSDDTYFKMQTIKLYLPGARVGDRVGVGILAAGCSPGGHGGMAYVDCVKIIPAATGTFDAPTTWSLNSEGSLGFRVGDMNGDGKDDLVRYQSNAIEVMFANSAGNAFGSPNTWATAYYTDLLVGDFNGDGKADVAGVSFNQVFVYLTNASGTGPQSSNQSLWSSAGPGAGGVFWVGDFDGDGKDDLLRRSSTSLDVLRSTGAPPFLNPEAWFSSFVASNDIAVGDFDGDGDSDLAYWWPGIVTVIQSHGAAHFFTYHGIWSRQNSNGQWAVGHFNPDPTDDLLRRSYPHSNLGIIGFDLLPAAGKSFATPERWWSGIGDWNARNYCGDFNGDGLDDVMQVNTGLGTSYVNVWRACGQSPCIFVRAGAPVCDPNDATIYNMPITVVNRSGLTLNSVVLVPSGPFTLTPDVITLGPALANGKSRTFNVEVSGAIPKVQQCFTAFSVPNTCAIPVCFTPPECDCMQVTDELYHCTTDGSGDTYFDFKVCNISGSSARFVRLLPAANFSPSLITLSPDLATGSTFGPLQSRITGVAPGSGINFVVQLLDPNMDLLCEADRGVDIQACPGTPGYCCVPDIGCVYGLDALGCVNASGGAFSLSPTVCLSCPVNLYQSPKDGAVSLQPIGEAYLTVSEGSDVFLSNIGATGLDGVAIETGAVTDFALNWGAAEAYSETPADGWLGLEMRGTVGGLIDQPLAGVSAQEAGDTCTISVDFSPLGPETIYALVIADTPQMFPLAAGQSVTTSALPAGIRTTVADETAGLTGFALTFDPPVQIQVPSAPEPITAGELRLLAGSGGPRVDYISNVQMRAVQIPTLEFLAIEATETLCLGDLNHDRIVDLSDLAAILLTYGRNAEGDLDADGETSLTDVALLLSVFGSNCP